MLLVSKHSNCILIFIIPQNDQNEGTELVQVFIVHRGVVRFLCLLCQILLLNLMNYTVAAHSSKLVN